MEYPDEKKADPSFANRPQACSLVPIGTTAQGPLPQYSPSNPQSTPSCSRQPSTPCHALHPLTPLPAHLPCPSGPSSSYSRPRGLRIANLLKPWIPIILYAMTSFGFLLAISFWKTEVFRGLDQLSQWLKSDEYLGHAVIFVLIFLTTFPPLPLYSTLIILSGYTFGPWTGAIISYCASLAGALTVFLLSRAFFRESISRWLSCTITIKRVVRAIEKRPKLLFLIRLAPYPFNVMNCLLAASPTLTLRTYTLCTALSLFKLIIHTSIGSSIHSFAEYHVHKPDQDQTDESNLGHYSTIVGIVLCLGILIYLSYIARKAVDEELEYDTGSREETEAFLSSTDSEELMTEVGDRRPSSQWTRPGPPRLESSRDDPFVYGGHVEASIGLNLSS